MKNILWLLLIASISSTAQNYTDVTDEKKTDELLTKFRQHQATEEDRIVLQQIAIALHDKGQQLDERNHDYKKSLQNIDKAISLYEALSDTLDIAFNKKYKAHILVRMNKIPQAKSELRTAIDLYRLKNTGAGVASSQFDLARIFEFENRADSAIYYANASRAYWKSQDNNLQALVINNMVVYHLVQLNQPEKAEPVYHDSETLLSRQAPHWQPLLDFYFTSMLLFRQTNDVTNAGHYRQLYLDKMESLRREGINAKSYYETFAQ